MAIEGLGKTPGVVRGVVPPVVQYHQRLAEATFDKLAQSAASAGTRGANAAPRPFGITISPVMRGARDLIVNDASTLQVAFPGMTREQASLVSNYLVTRAKKAALTAGVQAAQERSVNGGFLGRDIGRGHAMRAGRQVVIAAKELSSLEGRMTELYGQFPALRAHVERGARDSLTRMRSRLPSYRIAQA